MRIFSLYLATLVVLYYSCKPANGKKPSQNYTDIKEFVAEAKIDVKDILFFYSGKPRIPLPNVYCFDRNGVQIMAPPQCFQYIADYVQLLNDSIIPVKPGSESLQHFLDSTGILNVYDEVVNEKTYTGYDYYLFVDYVAIPIGGMKETLNLAKTKVDDSKKRIKLFLVHAISQSNKVIYKSESQARKDSVKTK